jgi:ADP-ribose pyrophosphatase YjhB (NUDIX family)
MIIPEDLYSQILKVTPIPCVDLVVQNEYGEVLLLKCANEPARRAWGFPGVRVHFGETRLEAAERKFIEECGLDS